MSESYPKPPTPAELRAQAVDAALGSEYDEMMLERNVEVVVNAALDNTERRVQQSTDEYLSKRPYLDSDGRARNADGKFGYNPPKGDRKKYIPQHIKDLRMAHIVTSDKLTSEYSEMEMPELEQILSEVRSSGGDDNQNQAPEIKNVVSQVEEAKLTKKREQWHSMGTLELARSVAIAELEKSEDAEAMDRVLFEKIFDQAEKIADQESNIGRTEAEVLGTVESRILGYKDSYKEKISQVQGQTQEDLQSQWDETRSKINYERVDNTRKLLDDQGAPTSDIMRAYPTEVFIGPLKTPQELQGLLPDVYFRWQDSLPTRTKNRIDKEIAANWMIKMNEAGVPHEIMQEFPAEFFFKDGDPDQDDESVPESFKEWLREHPDAMNGNAPEKVATDTDELQAAEPGNDNQVGGDDLDHKTEPVIQPEQRRRNRFMAGLNKFMTQEGAITWDKNGNAIVNTNLEKATFKEKATIISLGAVALGGVGFAIGHYIGTRDYGPLLEALHISSADTAARHAAEVAAGATDKKD